jgi:hypothetical protein
MWRQISTGLLSPVFNDEILDATELSGIVGHEREFERTGVRRNEKIVRTDYRSTRFERGADLRIVKSRFVGKVQNLDVPQILIEGSMILPPPGRHLNPEQQLRLGDDGDTDDTDWNLLQSSQNIVMRTLHDVGTKYPYRACTLPSEFALLDRQIFNPFCSKTGIGS